MAIVVGVLMLLGAGMTFLAAVGLLRMPDLYLRASAGTKATTLGVAATLLATALFFDDLGVTSRSVAIILFVFLTAPVAAHMIGRAAYLSNTPMWRHSVVDELKGRYDHPNRILHSPPEDQNDSPPPAG